MMKMLMQRGKSVKLLPTKEQEKLFIQSAGARRFVYNWGLQKQMEAFENKQPFISMKNLHKELVNLKNTNPDFAWLKDISCDVPKQALKDLEKAWHKYFNMQKQPGYKPYSKHKIEHAMRIGKKLTVYDRCGHPKFKTKSKTEDSFHCDCAQIIIVDEYIHVPKIGKVKVAIDGIFPTGNGRTDIKLYNSKVKCINDEWYFVASIDVDIDKIAKPKTEPIGIDLGVKDLAILSDSKKYKNINKTKRVKTLEKRKKRMQRRLSKKYERNKVGDKFVKTKNIQRLEKQNRKADHQLKSIRKNYLHQTTSEIVKRNPIYIAMEDLNVQGMMKNKHLSKAIQDQGLNTFRTYITYKCEAQGIQIYFADRFYPSSKKCSCCGNIKKDLKLRDRTYHCEQCNISIDRDINAAINLRNLGQEQYNKSINYAH